MKLSRPLSAVFILLLTLVLVIFLGGRVAATFEGAPSDGTDSGNLIVSVADPVSVTPGTEPASQGLLQTNLIGNGSFENTSDFLGTTGWLNATFSPFGGGWRVQTPAITSDALGNPLPSPTDGVQAALLDNTSDAIEPDGSFSLYQDFTLPSGITELSFDLAWHSSFGFENWTPRDSLSFDVENNKQISVDLLNPIEEFGAPAIDVLANLFRTEASTPTTSNGYLRFRTVIDNPGSAFSVRLRFVGVNNLSNLWHVEVDRVILTQSSTLTELNPIINQIDTANCPEIKVVTSVRDQQGNPVTGLTSTNFTLREDNQIRTITKVTTVGSGVSALFLAILIDRSGSLSFNDLSREKAAAKALVSQLQPTAQVAVYSFGSSVSLLQDFTSDRSSTNAAIDSIPSGGNTALYDAVGAAAQRLGTVSGRKALVLMTDGEDTASTAFSLTGAIAAAKAAGTPVFPIGFGAADSNVLTQLATQTSGFFSSSASSSDLQQILDAIGQVLSNQYEITFTTTSVTISHTIELTVTSQGVSGSSTSSFQPCGTPGEGVNVTINQVDPTECPTVRVITSVRDPFGVPITGLTTTNFTLREDSIERTFSVRTVEGGASALSLVILIDRSGSLSNSNLADEKNAAKSLVSQLRPAARVAVYSFGSTVNLLQNFTTNRTAINNAIDGIADGGDTALYDAIVDGSQLLASLTGRKAMVLMTDGEDTASGASLSQAIAAANSAGAPVFPIGFGNADFNVLAQMANQTGGFFSPSATSADLQEILNAIGQVLSNQYEITFTTTDVTRTHTIQVGVIHQGSSGTDTASLRPCGESNSGINVNINQVEQENCPTVRVITSVRDSSGISITGLTTTNFTLREDGIVQDISVNTASLGATLSLAILIDRSGSLSFNNLADEKAAAKALVAQLQPSAAVAVFSFGSTVNLLQDFTTNRPAINSAIDGITSGEDTSLYDAIFDGAKSLVFQTERKALVLMTDGEDTASSHTLSDAISAAKSAGVPVFPIGFGNANATVLTQLATGTGGFFSASASSSGLQGILSAIGGVLTNQYEIVFTSTKTSSTRIIEIAVTRDSVTGTAKTTIVPCEGGGSCESLVIDLKDSPAVPSNQIADIPTFGIPVTLSGSCRPAAFQFDITYNRNVFERGFFQPIVDTVLTQAGKDVTWNHLSDDSTRIVASGFNQNAISNGPALKLLFLLGDSLVSTETTVFCTNAQAVDAQARPLPVTCTDSTVTFGSCSCDINSDSFENVADVQLMINQALAVDTPTCDLNQDTFINVGDVQIVINAALGLGCNP